MPGFADPESESADDLFELLVLPTELSYLERARAGVVGLLLEYTAIYRVPADTKLGANFSETAVPFLISKRIASLEVLSMCFAICLYNVAKQETLSGLRGPVQTAFRFQKRDAAICGSTATMIPGHP